MHDRATLERAVDLQRKSYVLLRWLAGSVDRAQVSFDEVHDTLSFGEAAYAWLDRNYLGLPRNCRPDRDELRAFANLYATYLETSFDLGRDPGTLRVTDCGCLCDYCSFTVAASHLKTKKLDSADKHRADTLQLEYLRDVAAAHGATLDAAIAKQLATRAELHEPLAMATYARELVRRMAGDGRGPEVLALRRRFAWTAAGSPKPGFELDAEMLLAAEAAVRDAVAATI